MKKNFFWKLLLSFSIILIPSVLLTLAIYYQAYNLLENEINLSNRATLNQLHRQFDIKISEVSAIFNQISSDYNIFNSIQSDRNNEELTPYMIFSVRNRLSGIRSDGMQDLFIYYKNNGRIISYSRAAFKHDLYYKAYYMDGYLSYDDFLSVFSKYSYLKIVSAGGQYDVMIVQSFPVSPSWRTDATIVYKFDRNIVKNMMADQITNGSTILILDGENNIIAYAGNIIDFSNIKFSSGTDSFILNTGGMEYIIQTVDSTYNGIKYVSATPPDVFRQKLNRLRFLSILVFCLFTSVSAALVYLLAKLNYRPILELIGEIKKRLSDDTDKDVISNEFEYIKNILDSSLYEKDKIQDILRDDFLNNALNSVYNKNRSIFDQFKDVGIHLTSDIFTVVIIKSEKCETVLSAPLIQKAFNGLTDEGYGVYAVNKGGSTFLCVINEPETKLDENNKKIEKTPEDAIKYLKNEFNITCTVAIGGRYGGFEGIARSYAEAGSAMEYRSVLGPGRTLVYGKLYRDKFKYTFLLRGKAEQLILNCIKTRSVSPSEVPSEIKKYCGGDILLPDEFKCYFYDINDLLRGIIDKLNLDAGLLTNLSSCDDIVSFDNAVIDLLHILIEKSKTEEAPDNLRIKKLCSEVDAYIGENYHDPDLNVSSLGNVFNLSASYLSRLYKESSGEAISDYIAKVRLKHAKILLCETDLTIEEIAEEVGFLSSTSFIRLFGKYENITPGSYRKIHIFTP